jgi:hypothetical protein
MNMEDGISVQKMLTKIASEEKGWRKSLTNTEGSYSRNLAEANLRRLDTLRSEIMKQLDASERRRKQVMRAAIGEGMFTDHFGDGLCQQLVKEGWLQPADAVPLRRGMNRAKAYLPTEKAVQDWQPDSRESASDDSADTPASSPS